MEKPQNPTNSKENAVKYSTAAGLLATGVMLFNNSVQTHQPEVWKDIDCTTEIKKAINPKTPEIIVNPKLIKLLQNNEFTYSKIKKELGADIKNDKDGEYFTMGIKLGTATVFEKYYISKNNVPIKERDLKELSNEVEFVKLLRNSSCSAGSRLI